MPSVVYLSGFLTGDHFSFSSKKWNPHIRLYYPYELSNKQVNAEDRSNPNSKTWSANIKEVGNNTDKSVLMLRRWLDSWQVPLVDEKLQSEIFFSLLFLTDLGSQMIDNLYRDYLIERAEDMLSAGSNISVYPYLSIGRGQRFPSKGAYTPSGQVFGLLK